MVCYVILHYMAIDETTTCTNILLNKIKGNKKIIIVDNASPNKSGIFLQKKYQNVKDIDIILNHENSGFAVGNNIGYKYAKKKYNPDFIVAMNSDIEIVQENFEDIIYKIYNKEKFAVLGPDVYSTSVHVHQNPKRLTSCTLSEIEKLLKKYKKKNKSKIIVPLKCFLKKTDKLKRFVVNTKTKNLNIEYNKKYYNVPLHGSCLIFSKKFMKKRDEAFNSSTFMYYESEILDYECHKLGLKEVYDSSVKVLHHHSASTNLSYDSEIKKVRFMNENICNSLEKFVEIIKKND